MEYERKFLYKNWPIMFDNCRKEKIKQWYISTPEDSISIRIRLYDDNRCYLDFKRGVGIERYETGIKCSWNDVKHLTLNIPLIEKERFKVNDDNYLFIIDFFNSGLKLIEVEAKSLEDIKNFQPYDWMGQEVTDKVEYTNNWIAYNKKGQI